MAVLFSRVECSDDLCAMGMGIELARLGTNGRRKLS